MTYLHWFQYSGEFNLQSWCNLSMIAFLLMRSISISVIWHIFQTFDYLLNGWWGKHTPYSWLNQEVRCCWDAALFLVKALIDGAHLLQHVLGLDSSGLDACLVCLCVCVCLNRITPAVVMLPMLNHHHLAPLSPETLADHRNTSSSHPASPPAFFFLNPFSFFPDLFLDFLLISTNSRISNKDCMKVSDLFICQL